MAEVRTPKLRRIRIRRGAERIDDAFDASASTGAAELLARAPATVAPDAEAEPAAATVKALFAGALHARGQLGGDDGASKPAKKTSSRTRRPKG